MKYINIFIIALALFVLIPSSVIAEENETQYYVRVFYDIDNDFVKDDFEPFAYTILISFYDISGVERNRDFSTGDQYITFYSLDTYEHAIYVHTVNITTKLYLVKPGYNTVALRTPTVWWRRIVYLPFLSDR